MMQATSLSIQTEEFTGNQIAAAGALLEKVRKFLASLNVPLPNKEQFMKVVADAYDLYVAPIDIPQIPNTFEPWVDSALRSILLYQASAAYDLIAGQD